ncbi:MAG TPA: protein kinase [Thermoanaerobaculia bacterium]
MSDEEPVAEKQRLLDLAASIADGEAVDWAVVEGSARGEEKAVVRALRDIAGIAEAHRSWQAEPLAGDIADPERWGDLEILGRLGEGSYGDVYCARDPRLDREVALKLLRDGGTEDSGDRAVREGRLLARVHHTNVATVYGADRRDGRTGIWMELISGRTLAELVREQGPFGAREAALIALDVCRALAAVHAQGIVHRDIKAQNVMRAKGGRIVLTDFGIGRELRQEDAGGDERSLSGTPLYLAPEIFAGQKASVQSDLYSLGVLLYHLVTGKFPVRGVSLADIRRAHEQGEVRLLRDERPDLPEPFIRVVERALSPDPSKRYSSAGAFEQALSAVMDLDETGGRLPRSADRRRIRWAYMGAAAAVVIAVIVAVLWRQQSEAPAKTPDALLLQALDLHKRGEIEQAIHSLEMAVSMDPQFAPAYRHLASFLGGVGRYEESLAASQKAYELRSRVGEQEGYQLSATYYLGRLQYEQALDEFEKAVARDRTDAASWQEIAMLHANLGEPEAGLTPARRASEAEPQNLIHRGVGVFLLAVANQPDKALEEGRRARADFAEDPAATYLYWGEGLAWLVKGDSSQAKAAFRRLRQGGPTFASWGGILEAQSLVYEGALQEAAAELESGLNRDLRNQYRKNEAMRYYLMARIYALLGETKEAHQKLSHIERLKNVPIVLKELREAAILYVSLGDLQTAKNLLRRIEALRDDFQSRLSRGVAAQVRGEIESAEGHAEAARLSLEEARLEREDPSVLRSLARFWSSQGKCKRAVPILEQILRSKGLIMRDLFAGDWVLTHLDLARCQRSLGKTDEARKSYEQFLALWNDHDLAVVGEARAELAALPQSPR